MGGAQGALRVRPDLGHFAVDVSIGAFGGVDYNGLERVEVPLTGDVLFFLNPGDQLQLYGLAGIGFSIAHAEGRERGVFIERDYVHVGGELGAGVEFFLGSGLSLSADVRGFLRQRIDDNDTPEFIEVSSDGQVRTTDTSGGVVVSLGTTFYF